MYLRKHDKKEWTPRLQAIGYWPCSQGTPAPRWEQGTSVSKSVFSQYTMAVEETSTHFAQTVVLFLEGTEKFDTLHSN